jgi:hypothetical protein
MTITMSEAKALIARTEAAAKQENLLGVIMPNGKPLKDCTGSISASSDTRCRNSDSASAWTK